MGSHLPFLPAAALVDARSLSGPAWRLADLAGHLVELSGHGASATLTFAMRLVWEAQRCEEPVAWIAGRERFFYPPDAARNGVDLDALAVVLATSLDERAKAADLLLRSGAFGLLVLDLDDARLTERQLTRLLGLARKHRTAVVCLTRKTGADPSLGAAISLRADVRRTRIEPRRYGCELIALK
ncbi:MAG TPA: hypothetical protein V6D47_13500, partial [Oscillatoriaceae cyanobacterium]